MKTSSFVYEFIVPAPPGGADTRQPVLVDVDFTSVVFPGQKAYLVYLSLIGMRQNTGSPMSDPGGFSARLIGNFESDNSPVYSMASPRPGETIIPFDGITFGSNNPLYLSFENWNIPSNFQIEFFPSNDQGISPGDVLTMYFTIGYLAVP